jgi:hypothetical protein
VTPVNFRPSEEHRKSIPLFFRILTILIIIVVFFGLKCVSKTNCEPEDDLR